VRVLVTGGAGFIGSHVAERLVDSGFEVRVLDNFSTGTIANVERIVRDIEIVQTDVRDADDLLPAVRGCDAVLHFAALGSVPRSVEAPRLTHEVNATGTLNVIRAAGECGVRRLVYASSSSVYGQNGSLPSREDQPLRPMSPYAVSKLAGEGYCRALGQLSGLETVTLRLFNIFGPRQPHRVSYSAVVPSFACALLEGRSPVIFGDGTQSRAFTYVEDAVEAAMLALRSAAAVGGIYNVAGERRTSVRALFDDICELVGERPEPTFAPTRAGDIHDTQADRSAARRDLGFEPRIDLRDGLRNTIEHIRGEIAAAAGQV
jgi:UDP-glucose 4-epimerase